MGLQFEGAIDNISEPQIAFIRDVLQKRRYKDTKVIIEPVGQAGDNYMASVKRIIAKDENKELRMIAKFAPQIEAIRESTKSDQLFGNEHVMYTMVFPKFQELEELAGVHKNNRLRFAKCYGSLSEAPHEMILLEDLQVPGFTMLNRFKPLSDECVKSVLKNFALLHSLSFTLKHKEPERFNQFKNSLHDAWGNLCNAPDRVFYFNYVENMAVKVVDGDRRKIRLKGTVSQAPALYAKMSTEVTNSKYSVIQQGDAWTNNILFKFNGDTLEESVMIDYQVSKENNPAFDLLYMIFLCTNHEDHLQSYVEWIDYYHSELDRALGDHGLKAAYVYPKEQLDVDLKRHAKPVLAFIMVLTSLMVLKPEEAAKIQQAANKFSQDIHNPDYQALLAEVTTSNNEFVLVFKKRLEGLVDSFVKFGLL